MELEIEGRELKTCRVQTDKGALWGFENTLHVPSVRVGDCAIASSFVSYLGPFNREFRELLLARNFVAGCASLGIPCTRDLKITAFLVDDAEVGQWTLQVRVKSICMHASNMCWCSMVRCWERCTLQQWQSSSQCRADHAHWQLV